MAPLQWLKMEALIRTPADCEALSVIKFLMQRAQQPTPEHKAQRKESALKFLQRYHNGGDEFLDWIVTGDEMWVAHITPETKQ